METQCEVGGGGGVPLLTCHCGPSRPILALINEAVGSDSLGKSRAVFPFTEAAHVYLPTTDGAPRGPQEPAGLILAQHPSS